MSIVEILKKNRPKLSDSSLKTYISILKSTYKKIFPTDDEINIKKYEDTDKFFKFLEPLGNKKKTYLSALYILTQNKKYHEVMIKDANEYNEQSKSQKMDEKQKKNWITQDEIKELYKKYETQANLLYKLQNLTNKNLQQIQNFIILSLMSGQLINIRRLLDWSEMKISNYDEKEDNFLKQNKGGWSFTFNKYKTKQFLGEQDVYLPTKLMSIIKKWLKLLKSEYPESEYLLIDSNGKKLNPTKLNQRLNLIFGKNAGVNILRHSFITEKYKHLPGLKEMEKEAKEFSHSLEQHLLYIKK